MSIEMRAVRDREIFKEKVSWRKEERLINLSRRVRQRVRCDGEDPKEWNRCTMRCYGWDAHWKQNEIAEEGKCFPYFLKIHNQVTVRVFYGVQSAKQRKEVDSPSI